MLVKSITEEEIYGIGHAQRSKNHTPSRIARKITEEEIYGIGHAFGYYDYGEETGMSAAFSG